MDDYKDYKEYEDASDAAEKDLKIEGYVYISFEDCNHNRLYSYDIPRHMLNRWRWLFDWRLAKLVCANPRGKINMYYSFYDKKTGTKMGSDTLLSSIIAHKAQVTIAKNKIKKYIEIRTGELFFDPDTDEGLKKAYRKLEEKQTKLENLLSDWQATLES